MDRLIEKIGYYVSVYEGWLVPGSLSVRNNNPGNLRASPLPRPKDAKGFVKFRSDKEGLAQLYHQISLDVCRGLTLRQFISKYAPPNENHTEEYVKFVANGVGINPDTPMMEELDYGD